ncbi:MAG: hypothetical protein ACI9VX_000994, partial [Dinoroseobacter sp.]
PEIAPDSRASCTDVGTRRPNGLICAQLGVKITGKAFYLGNVG